MVTSRGRTRLALLRLTLCFLVVPLRSAHKHIPYKDSKCISMLAMLSILLVGGRILIGVADNGEVFGIPCNRQQEDSIRIKIDNVIGRFQPPVFPKMYSVSFIPVLPENGNYDSRHCIDDYFKVLEVKVHRQLINVTLFETDKGDVFIRRDGSVQGPLKASQIIDWCRFNQILEYKQGSSNNNNTFNGDQPREYALDNSWKKNRPETAYDDALYDLPRPSEHDQPSEYRSMLRITELEANMASRQAQIEREIDKIKLSYETREQTLQDELEKSRAELRKRKRPSSAVCTII